MRNEMDNKEAPNDQKHLQQRKINYIQHSKASKTNQKQEKQKNHILGLLEQARLEKSCLYSIEVRRELAKPKPSSRSTIVPRVVPIVIIINNIICGLKKQLNLRNLLENRLHPKTC